MKKILPLSEPLITSYPYYANIFSLVGARTDYHIPWIYNYFVQLYVFDNLEERLRIDYVTPYLGVFFPFIEENYVSREIALQRWDGIIHFIRDYVDHGYCIYALFDVSQIAEYDINFTLCHDMMLYGYDDERKEVYFADNFKSGKYARGIATYEEIINASQNYMNIRTAAGDNIKPFCCRRYKEGRAPFPFDKSEYIESLVDYVESKNRNKYGWGPRKHEKCIYGIDIYAYMHKHLHHVKNSKRILDQRGFYVQWEHKTILEKSLTYILGAQWKSSFPVEYGILKQDIELSYIILNLCKIISKLNKYNNKTKTILVSLSVEPATAIF